MSKKEYNKSLKDYKKEVTSTIDTSRQFLIELGVLTKNGNVKGRYKELCIPKDQI